MDVAAPRRIRLCADDYGLSEGVNRGIRELMAQRRINATSLMVVGAATSREEISALKTIAENQRCEIGLHVTLTAPFSPLTMPFTPLTGGVFLPLGQLLRISLLRRIDVDAAHAEIAAQIAEFTNLLGRPPDYLDGHQHVQIFPGISEAFLQAAKAAAPDAWVRQCGRAKGPWQSGGNVPATLKAVLLDLLSRRFRRRCEKARVVFNPGFAGAYDYLRDTDFGAAMQGFLSDLPDNGLVMCHPGFVDDALLSLDPLTYQREREYAYLASDAFPALLAAQRIELI